MKKIIETIKGISANKIISNASFTSTDPCLAASVGLPAFISSAQTVMLVAQFFT